MAEITSVTLLGLAAATLTTLAFVPQVLKTWRAKSARDLSLGTFSILASGVLLWLIYGILIGDLPIIAANTITLALLLVILVFKVIYRE